MKKLFFMAIAFAAFTISANAQTDAVKPQLSKEEKAKIKAQKEQDLTDALNQLGITDDQKKQVRETLDIATKKGNELKNNASLSEEQKAEEKKKINNEKNAKLKEILGKEKYSQFNSIRKQQNEKYNTPAGNQ